MPKINKIIINNDGMEKTQAKKLWNDIAGFASYSFNKSHAAEYTLISYQMQYLKQHYPVEFYAAALSTVGEAKLQVIVNDAAKKGIKLLPPDINISTNEFVIGNDTTLFMPFNRIKGISDRSGEAIIKARELSSIEVEERVKIEGSRKSEIVTRSVPVAKGRFTSYNDFLARVEKRAVNSAHTAKLDLVGAFARIEPEQKSAEDESRRKDQMKLLPGLMSGVLIADRAIPVDKFTLARLDKLRQEINDAAPGVHHAAPAIGSKAKFMVVFDGPTQDEEAHKQFTAGGSFSFVLGALKTCDLERKDGYWTGLIKRKKQGKSISMKELKLYQPFFEKELELLKPPVILTLGSTAARFFNPDLKGDIMDHVGTTFYSEKYDAMIVIGFNPQMCHFSPDKWDHLAEVFDIVRSMVSPI